MKSSASVQCRPEVQMAFHPVAFRSPVAQDMALRVQAAQARRLPAPQQFTVPGATSEACCKAVGPCPFGQICRTVTVPQGTVCFCYTPPIAVNPRVGSQGDMALRVQAAQMGRFPDRGPAIGIEDTPATSCATLGACPPGEGCVCIVLHGKPADCRCAVLPI